MSSHSRRDGRRRSRRMRSRTYSLMVTPSSATAAEAVVNLWFEILHLKIAHAPKPSMRLACLSHADSVRQWVWTMKTLHGARLATSPAIEPSTRAAPCTRLLPTTMTEASRRVASSHSARGRILHHDGVGDRRRHFQFAGERLQQIFGDADRVDVPCLRAAAVDLLAGVAGHRHHDVQRPVVAVGHLGGRNSRHPCRLAAVDSDDDLVHIAPLSLRHVNRTNRCRVRAARPLRQSEAPDSRMWPIRQFAITSETTVTISSRTIAAPPCGIPSRISRLGGSSRRPTKMARDSQVGESWAIPVSAAPSRRSMRNTIASDHTAVRRVMHPTVMNRATYVMLPTAAATYAGHALLGRAGDHGGQRAGRSDGDKGNHRATQPTTEHDLPGRRRGEPGEVERAGADLCAENGISDHERGDRHDEREDPFGRDIRERTLRAGVDCAGQQAEQQCSRARQQDCRPPSGWHTGLQGVTQDGDEPGPRASHGGREGCVVVFVIAPAPGRGSRASRRGRGLRAGESTPGGRGVATRLPVRELARFGSRDRRVSCPS